MATDRRTDLERETRTGEAPSRSEPEGQRRGAAGESVAELSNPPGLEPCFKVFLSLLISSVQRQIDRTLFAPIEARSAYSGGAYGRAGRKP